MVLEVASGSGEHAAYFAERFPDLDWQPSDPDPDALNSIEAWRADFGLPNLREPVILDAAADAWPIERAGAVLNINMVHISAWTAANAARSSRSRRARCISTRPKATPVRTVSAVATFAIVDKSITKA